MTSRFLKILQVLLFALGIGTIHLGTAFSKELRVIAVTSHQSSPYEEVLTGFQQSLQKSGAKKTLEVVSLQGDPARMRLKKNQKNQINLLFAIGSLALSTARREMSDIPMVAGLILNEEEIKKAGNATGVFLQFPLETQFQWLCRFLPQSKTIGALYNPQENQRRMERAVQVAQRMGLKLHLQEVRIPKHLPQALNNLGNQVDALWSVPDQVVAIPGTVKHLLLFSFRNRIPLIGFSEAWVKAGALYSLGADYKDIGIQCGEMALRVLLGNVVSSIPPAPPRKVLYFLNLRTAMSMDIDIPEPLIQNAHRIFKED